MNNSTACKPYKTIKYSQLKWCPNRNLQKVVFHPQFTWMFEPCRAMDVQFDTDLVRQLDS